MTGLGPFVYSALETDPRRTVLATMKLVAISPQSVKTKIENGNDGNLERKFDAWKYGE